MGFRGGEAVVEVPPMSRSADAIVEFANRAELAADLELIRQTLHASAPPVFIGVDSSESAGHVRANLEYAAERLRSKTVFIYIAEIEEVAEVTAVHHSADADKRLHTVSGRE